MLEGVKQSQNQRCWVAGRYERYADPVEDSAHLKEDEEKDSVRS